MRLRGVTFPEAVRRCRPAGIVTPSGKPARPRPPAASPAKALEAARGSLGVALSDALALIADAEQRLWTPEGTEALAYLEGRGLTAETIRSPPRVGSQGDVAEPPTEFATGERPGVTIPWFDRDRLALVKIRQPEGATPEIR